MNLLLKLIKNMTNQDCVGPTKPKSNVLAHSLSPDLDAAIKYVHRGRRERKKDLGTSTYMYIIYLNYLRNHSTEWCFHDISVSFHNDDIIPQQLVCHLT